MHVLYLKAKLGDGLDNDGLLVDVVNDLVDSAVHRAARMCHGCVTGGRQVARLVISH